MKYLPLINQQVKPDSPPGDRLIDYVRHRLMDENKNWLAAVLGGLGSGKSYTGLTICMKIDPTFTEERICFTPAQYMNIINTDIKRGQAVLFDETSLVWGQRDFMTLTSKLLSRAMTANRFMNFATIFTAPSIKFFDATARRLLHTQIETISINHEENVTICKWLDLNISPRTGDVYYHFPRIKFASGKIAVVDRINVPKPPEEMCEAYEKKRKIYIKAMNKSIESQIMSNNARAEGPIRFDPFEVAQRLMVNLKQVQTKHGFISPELIMAHQKLPINKAKQVKQVLDQYVMEIEPSYASNVPNKTVKVVKS